MSELSENTISVIKQTDPDLPKYLDFKNLRREGLKHIGNLAGKIWTDHNVHDPGITTLEVLVYALIDLGYKTNLPFEDLIARENYQDKDDNFLTPLEILTVNPVTITDYRKLLLEIEGVRNAWLEPVKQELKLFIDQNTNSLSCSKPDNPNNDDVIFSPEGLITVQNNNCTVGENFEEIHLNGLYKVYIEKENDVADEVELKKEVREVLSKHRNLCEDFVDVKVLEPINFGACVDVETRSGYDPIMIYSKIIKAIKNFIQPVIRYYTLNELLNKGKAIDDIFAGRPYSEKSFGFVDTDEFEKLERRSEIHLSDLYHIILKIEGVRKIKKIHLNKENKNAADDALPLDWVQTIGPCEVPVFSLNNTCVDIYSEQGIIKFDKLKIHRSFSFRKKFELPINSLNNGIPFGAYHDDLNDYYSIQNDFPVVYGIGEDGLPESATLQRKTQALQLKGYLMFYDQILANYTAQLANIRSLFSLKSEQEKSQDEKKTYFTQTPAGISGIEDLLRFHDTEQTQQQSSVLAFPVLEDDRWKKALKDLEKNPRTEFSIGNYCEDKSGLVELFTFSSSNIRSININQLIDSFLTQNYSIQILEDRFGCFFVLRPSLPKDVLIVGTKRYESVRKAKSEAKNVAFIAAVNSSYNLVTNKSENIDPDRHYFGIIYHPISYIDIIQTLTENKEEYIWRRKQFLDHLLARFGEEFTDYTLLQYKGKLSESESKEEMINDQSSYINEFAELSRNRGKAFNYLEPSWNTNNVSGFEKRVSLLSGINNYQRRNLCNFEVTTCYRLLLNDPNGNPFFRSNRSYETKEELNHAATDVLVQLRDSKLYKLLEKSLNGFNAKAIGRIFSEIPQDENIIVTKYRFYQQLLNSENNQVSLSDAMSSKNIALKNKGEFVKVGIQQILPNSSNSDKNKAYRLLPIGKDDHYLDVTNLDKSLTINPIETWKWHINTKSNEKLSSDISFSKSDNAWDELIKNAALEPYLTQHKTGYKWTLTLVDEKISFEGVNCYPDKNKATAAWRKAKVVGSDVKNYTIEKGEKTDRLILRNEKKKIIAISEENKKFKANIVENCTKVFSNRKTRPSYKKETTKVGFRIPINDVITPLVSYCIYDTKKEALQELGKVFKLGSNKKNYLESGDEGNAEYNFLLRDELNSFLALPPEHFEIASNRNKALNAILRFFKNSEPPVLVKKQPNTYTWSLFDNEKVILTADAEFSSIGQAQSNFDTVIAAESLKSCHEVCMEHIYQFHIISTPSEFNFIYGNTNPDHKLNPLFISNSFYNTREDAITAYTEFVKKLPNLSFKASKENETSFEYALYAKSTPIAIQYTNGADKGSLIAAKELTNYIHKMYTDNKTPNDEFVISDMAESQVKSYEWRFYKKNAPLARNPDLYEDKEKLGNTKKNICDVIPPIDLKKCPPKEIVICLDKDYKIVSCLDKNIKTHHYQVCFDDTEGKEFVLRSYVGYKTQTEAVDAWKKEWLQVINLARDPEQYKLGGKISPIEVYKNPESRTCNETSFIAVIPDKRKTNKVAQELIDHYIQQANLFPIYKVEIDEDDEEIAKEILKCNGKYKYRVVVPDENNYQGDLLWDSVDCFEGIQETIDAYRHFYNLAGTHNNCRILCEKGKYYIGLVEVLVESSCDFVSKEEAWDDAFPGKEDSCGDCIPGGVRAFIYAAEDDKNYIPVCDQKYWKFKVVSPSYFVVDHNCWYNSECERDELKNKLLQELNEVNWSAYMTGLFFENNSINLDESPLAHMPSSQSNKETFKTYCDIVHNIRECLRMCSKGIEKAAQNEEIRVCLKQKFKAYLCTEKELKNETCTDEKLEKHNKALELYKLLESKDPIDVFQSLVKYFPIYKTDKGYCYKLYCKENDNDISEGGLQPCGCENEKDIDDKKDIGGAELCDEIHPFISSNCYACCAEAFDAFKEFCELIEIKKTYELEPISKTKYGPYSFQLIDTSKELGYHPQQYKCLQEVEDAIQITKDCVSNAGMHLLEHILLRPKTESECGHKYINGDDVSLNDEIENCLLPICPDYCCDIEWQPDLEKDDPCAEKTDQNIYYLPGTDPYSFWATVALPSWVKQFRTKESRQIFESLLYKEVPALVGLNILWLSPSNMCKFEDEYRRWLAWIESSKEFLCEPGRLPICSLADCIKTLKSEKACESMPGEQGDCDCEGTVWENEDECCFPNETEGTIFWSCCEASDPVVFGLRSNLESATESIEKPVAKSKAVKKQAISKPKPVIKKVKKAAKKETDLLAIVRQRKPKYFSNITELADDDMLKTKSYERTVFFLQNTPTITAYTQLVNFFKRYSLQKDNNTEGFLGLLKNATWHLFDTLVLDQKRAVKKEDLDSLKTNLQILNSKGLLLKKLVTEWGIEEVKSLANTKTLSQLKKIIKVIK